MKILDFCFFDLGSIPGVPGPILGGPGPRPGGGLIGDGTHAGVVPWGEFKIEVIFFPRGAPRGGTPGRGSPGGVQGAVRASHLANKSRDKTPGVFFHAALDVDAPGNYHKPPKLEK